MPLPTLADPVHLLDLPTEGDLVAHLSQVEHGQAVVRLPRAPLGLTVELVRLHLVDADQLDGKPYWDVSTSRSRDALLTVAGLAVRTGQAMRFHKFGVAPAAYFSVELLPPNYAGPAGILWPGRT